MTSAAVAGSPRAVTTSAKVFAAPPAPQISAAVAGSASAGYLTPLAIPAIAGAVGIAPSAAFENAAAFLLGLTSMNVIPGLIHLSEIFRRDPAAALRGKDVQP